MGKGFHVYSNAPAFLVVFLFRCVCTVQNYNEDPSTPIFPTMDFCMQCNVQKLACLVATAILLSHVLNLQKKLKTVKEEKHDVPEQDKAVRCVIGANLSVRHTNE